MLRLGNCLLTILFPGVDEDGCYFNARIFLATSELHTPLNLIFIPIYEDTKAS